MDDPIGSGRQKHAKWNADKCWEMAEEYAKDTDFYRSVDPELSEICKGLTFAHIYAAAQFETLLKAYRRKGAHQPANEPAPNLELGMLKRYRMAAG